MMNLPPRNPRTGMFEKAWHDGPLSCVECGRKTEVPESEAEAEYFMDMRCFWCNGEVE